MSQCRDQTRRVDCRSLVFFLAVIAGLAACGPAPTASPAAEAKVTCPTGHFGEPSTMSCQEAVAAAAARLPLGHDEVTSVEMGYGFFCPPGRLTCQGPRPDSAYVVFTFETGEPILVSVKESSATGAVSVTEVGPLPTGP